MKIKNNKMITEIIFIDSGPYHNNFDEILNFYDGSSSGFLEKNNPKSPTRRLEIKKSLNDFNTLVIFERNRINDFEEILKFADVSASKKSIKIINSSRSSKEHEISIYLPDKYDINSHDFMLFKFLDYELVRSFVILIEKSIPKFELYVYTTLKKDAICRCSQ